MPPLPVPITMGSEGFVTRDVTSLQVTHAWFPPGAFLEAHVHERPTVAVMLEGGFDLVFSSAAIRRRTFECRPGTIITEPACEKHANRFAAAGARVVVIQPDLQREAWPTRCTALFERISHFRDAPVAAAARRLARELLWPDDLTALAVEGLGLELVAEAARLEAAPTAGCGAAPGWLDRAVEYAHEHYRRGIRIADLASAAGVHPAHLAAVFRRVHRVPVATYVRRLRVDWAADRLVASDDSISLIAAEAGFADQAHLTRAFRRMTGATPAAYRRARRRTATGPVHDRVSPNDKGR